MYLINSYCRFILHLVLDEAMGMYQNPAQFLSLRNKQSSWGGGIYIEVWQQIEDQSNLTVELIWK